MSSTLIERRHLKKMHQSKLGDTKVNSEVNKHFKLSHHRTYTCFIIMLHDTVKNFNLLKSQSTKLILQITSDSSSRPSSTCALALYHFPGFILRV